MPMHGAKTSLEKPKNLKASVGKILKKLGVYKIGIVVVAYQPYLQHFLML